MNQSLVVNVFFDADGSVENFVQLLDKAIQQPETQALFILACDENGFTPQNIDARLQALPIPICGAIFPQIIYQKQHYTKGTLICSLSQMIDVCNMEKLSVYQKTDSFLPNCQWLNQAQNVIILVDGLTSNIDPFIEDLYNQLGSQIPIVGSGAGSLSFQQKPCLFSNQGLLVDAVQLINIKGKVGIGIKHGWKAIGGPFLVTHAEGAAIHSLNYEPAFPIYRKTVEPIVEQQFNENNFFSIAKQFPFGLDKIGDELLVRDPIKTEQDTLVCVGRVPQNALTYILKGEPEALISAAGEAAKEANSQIQDNTDNLALIFDCISRVLFLEENFVKELEEIETNLPQNIPTFGALTFGEIATSTQGGIQFFNKTTVIGLFSSTI